MVFWPQQQDDVDEFIDSFQHMFEEGGGEPPGFAAPGEPSVGSPLRQYDPKAKVFVGKGPPNPARMFFSIPVEVCSGVCGGLLR